jgi:hypothetical protein
VPGQNWTLNSEATLGQPFSWHSLILSIQPDKLVFYLDGRVIHVTPLTSGSTMYLNVGAFLPGSPFYGRYAFTGTISSLLAFSSAQLTYTPAIAVGEISNPSNANLTVISQDSGNWSVSFSSRTLTLEGNSGTYIGVSDTSVLSFGRYTTGSPALNVRIMNLKLVSMETGNILGRVIVLSIGSPVALACIWLDRSLSKFRGRRGRTPSSG